MANNWIFDVLADLRGFALANGLPGLADQMAQAARVAEAELAARNAPLDRVPEGQGARVN